MNSIISVSVISITGFGILHLLIKKYNRHKEGNKIKNNLIKEEIKIPVNKFINDTAILHNNVISEQNEISTHNSDISTIQKFLDYYKQICENIHVQEIPNYDKYINILTETFYNLIPTDVEKIIISYASDLEMDIFLYTDFPRVGGSWCLIQNYIIEHNIDTIFPTAIDKKNKLYMKITEKDILYLHESKIIKEKNETDLITHISSQEIIRIQGDTKYLINWDRSYILKITDSTEEKYIVTKMGHDIDPEFIEFIGNEMYAITKQGDFYKYRKENNIITPIRLLKINVINSYRMAYFSIWKNYIIFSITKGSFDNKLYAYDINNHKLKKWEYTFVKNNKLCSSSPGFKIFNDTIQILYFSRNNNKLPRYFCRCILIKKCSDFLEMSSPVVDNHITIYKFS